MSHENKKIVTQRIGRMAQWHKNIAYIVLITCSATGLLWFGLGEFAEFLPPQLRFWWITHGLSGLLTLCIIGSALPQHIIVTWRSHRNRLAGAIATLIFALIAISTGLLFYGTEGLHAPVKWIHITLGLCLCLIFPWHILKGRKSTARPLQRTVIR